MAALSVRQFNVARPGTPAERVRGADVSADLFQMLGIQPEHGRVFTADESQAGRKDIVVLSHRLWQRHFGADTISEQKLRLDGEIVTVIGVMPSGFENGVEEYFHNLA
jgi:hypothetical protein